MLNFWTKVRDYAAAKVGNAYMDKFHHARQCPNCNVWTHQTMGAKAVVDLEYDQLMQCEQCDVWSRWDMTSMIPVLAHPWRCDAPPTDQQK
jgi:hypothetical protein